jgi:hypothetical protein
MTKPTQEDLETRKVKALESIAEELTKLNNKLNKVIAFDDPKGYSGSIYVVNQSI